MQLRKALFCKPAYIILHTHIIHGQGFEGVLSLLLT